MEENRVYYEAYEDRYKQVHSAQLQWFTDDPSPIVREVIARYGIGKADRILELGCGEGRDARALLKEGYDLLATDVSQEAVSYCRAAAPEAAQRFQRLDCVTERLAERFRFIYAVAVLHMLVRDEDRDGFYRFIREHLEEKGVALICMMGDGTAERASDIASAFDLQERSHERSGRTLLLAGTSCRIVSRATLEKELKRNGLTALEQGFTEIPEYAVPGVMSQMMYVVVGK